MEKSQAESFVCGVGPAESTGKPRSRYCPGGSLPLVSLGWRRPRNPREKNPSLIVSPPVLLSLCSYYALVYHAQTFSRLRARGARWTLPLLLFSGRRDLAGCAYRFLSARHRDFAAPPDPREPSRHYTGSETIIRLSTSVTPGAEQTDSSAAFFSV